MRRSDSLGEEFVRLALAVDEHLPGYVDSYFGPESWKQEANDAGKVPLEDLARRAALLADGISQAGDLDGQRKDFLSRQVTAMQMSLQLLEGEKVSVVEEAGALYDIKPQWKDESIFADIHKQMDEILPGKGPLKERLEVWNKALEIPLDKIKELLPVVAHRLRELTRKKFSLPGDESFRVEFVSDQPWIAYNWYLGDYQSRIEINTDLPVRVDGLAELMAHEGYPGHHTELSIKEFKLARQRNYQEFLLFLTNAPACSIAEGIATTALETVLSDEELADWYAIEILPRAGMTHIDAKIMVEVGRAARELESVRGNAVFMMYDQNRTPQEIRQYAQDYGLNTDQEADQVLTFISVAGSYLFTYFAGRSLLEELFRKKDRDSYFTRLLTEPVTPSQVRQWIESESRRD